MDIPRDIVYDMEDILKDKMPVDQDGYIIFENFLPILGKASFNEKVWITGGKFISLFYTMKFAHIYCNYGCFQNLGNIS